MFKLNEIQSLFICPICKTTFQDPVTLTCGKTVCKQHCEEIIKDDCQFCNEKHSIPKNGFIVNEIINTQLELHVDKINMSFPQYEDYKKTLEDLNKGLKEVETSMNNQESYLSDYFGEITRQVDLRRETVIEDIHDYSNKIIQNINNIKEECLEKSKTSLKIKENIQTFKDKLKILNDMFNSLDMDDNKFKELLTQKQLDEAQRLIQPLLNDCKLECHKKFYKLETNDIQLNKFFGSIIGYDFDHEKIKKVIFMIIFLDRF